MRLPLSLVMANLSMEVIKVGTHNWSLLHDHCMVSYFKDTFFMTGFERAKYFLDYQESIHTAFS
jgi:hypothetical protein